MKDEHPVILTVAIAALLSTAFTYLHVLSKVSSGIAISICAVVSAAIVSFIHPIDEEGDEA